MFTVNPRTLTNNSFSTLTIPLSVKKFVATNLLMSVLHPPSIRRKRAPDVFSVLKGYGYIFLRKCCKPVTSLLVPYIRGVAELTKRILSTHNGKVSLFRYWGIFSLNLRYLHRLCLFYTLQRLRICIYWTNQTAVWYAFK